MGVGDAVGGRGASADVIVVPGRTSVRCGVYRLAPPDPEGRLLVVLLELVEIFDSRSVEFVAFPLRAAAADMSRRVKYDV